MEAGYYANVVGYHAPPLYDVSTTVVRIGSLACFWSNVNVVLLPKGESEIAIFSPKRWESRSS